MRKSLHLRLYFLGLLYSLGQSRILAERKELRCQCLTGQFRLDQLSNGKRVSKETRQRKEGSRKWVCTRREEILVLLLRDEAGKGQGLGCQKFLDSRSGFPAGQLWTLGKLLDSLKVKVKLLSRVRLFVTPWTVAYQAPPSIGFSRQEYWSELPFSSPLDSLRLPLTRQ